MLRCTTPVAPRESDSHNSWRWRFPLGNTSGTPQQQEHRGHNPLFSTSTSLLVGQSALQIPELEVHIFTPKLSRSESPWDAGGIFVTCSLEALWQQPGPMLPAAVLCSLLPPAKQFPCFPTLPGSQYSEQGWAERVLSLQQPQNLLTPAMAKQQIPFPKIPFITSLL